MTAPASDSLNQQPRPLAAIRSERDRFVALAFCWADLLFELDGEANVVYAAGAVELLCGRPPEKLVGCSVVDLVVPSEHTLVLDLLNVARKRGRFENSSVNLLNGKRQPLPMTIAGYTLDGLNGHFFVALRRENSRSGGANQLARDEQTGLCVGDSFIDMVTRELATAGDGEQRQMTLIALPGYAELQDRLAETVERQLLTTIGACLQASSVDGSAAARLGTDRYGLIHSPSLDMANLQGRVAQLTREADPTHAGITMESTTMDIDDDVLGDTDFSTGLSIAINSFRSCKDASSAIHNLSSGLSSLTKQAIGTFHSFKNMIAGTQFHVAFQPIVDARTGDIHHFEALARFPTSCDGRSTFEQISFAEQTGLIVDFDLAMTQKIIDWLSKTPLNSNIRVAVNVSGKSVDTLSFLARLDRILKDNAWTRGRLMFEITESARMENLSAADTFIQHLRKRGYLVCLDDFGAGAANFDYLSSLDVDIVKLDGSAIRGARKTQRGKAFLKAFIGLCRELGVATVAEMIDEDEALVFVRACGVQFVQGRLFGHPSPDILVFKKNIPSSLFPKRRASQTPPRRAAAAVK
jgi:EAL domain-containing protein (putative c-di-GMP-specific phosphodiesterase class I)/GGDEF domain-containing protein